MMTEKSLQIALGHLQSGDWEAAHRLVQNDPSPLAAWAHGIVHLMEGDRSNAEYWYRRAGRLLEEPVQLERELSAFASALD